MEKIQIIDETLIRAYPILECLCSVTSPKTSIFNNYLVEKRKFKGKLYW